MANNEIHNYINEQTTPTDGDFMDLDADQGGGSYLSKKMTLSNLRKWLFKLVSQEVVEYTGSGNVGSFLNFNNVFIFNCNGNSQLTKPPFLPYDNSATYIIHIHNLTGASITIDAGYTTTPDNPPITRTVGGYAQVWITYHKKADNTETWTANTINFI